MAEPHRVAQADLRGEVFRHLLAHPHEPLGERQHKALDVGPCDVLQMASRPHARLERGVDHLAVAVHALLAALELQLVEDVVVGRTGQHACLGQPRFLHQAEVALDRANPAGAFGILVSQLAAPVERGPVVLRVEEELGLPHHAVGPAEFRQQVVDVHHLVDGVRRPGLLAVAERGVGDVDVPRLERLRVELDLLSVDHLDHRAAESDQRRHPVVERSFEQVRLGRVDQGMRFSFIGHGHGEYPLF